MNTRDWTFLPWLLLIEIDSEEVETNNASYDCRSNYLRSTAFDSVKSRRNLYGFRIRRIMSEEGLKYNGRE